MGSMLSLHSSRSQSISHCTPHRSGNAVAASIISHFTDSPRLGRDISTDHPSQPDNLRTRFHMFLHFPLYAEMFKLALSLSLSTIIDYDVVSARPRLSCIRPPCEMNSLVSGCWSLPKARTIPRGQFATRPNGQALRSIYVLTRSQPESNPRERRDTFCDGRDNRLA